AFLHPPAYTTKTPATGVSGSAVIGIHRLHRRCRHGLVRVRGRSGRLRRRMGRGLWDVGGR
ncbi:hypothetical protein HDV00_001728, partial [Rhizophlyctis rosea]